MIDDFLERYKEKNIERFFKQLLPFGNADNIAIAKEVQRLCNLVAHKYKQEFEEVELLVQRTNTLANQKSNRPLHDVFKSINGNQTIGVHHLPIFIASNLLLTSYDHTRFEQYKALTLLCVTRLAFIGSHQSKIKAICDDVRLFSQGKRENMAAYLPDIHVLDFPSLVVEFQLLVDEENTTPPPSTVVNQLNHYRRSYEASLDHSEGFTRKTTFSEFKKSGQLQTSDVKTLDDDEASSLLEIQQIQPSIKFHHQWQREDESGDATRTLNIVTSKSSNPKSYAAEAMLAQAVKNKIAKKEMAMACDTSVSTNYEIGAVVNFCLTQIEENTSTKPAQLLLIMLITGNTSAQVKKLKTKRLKPSGLIGFQRTHTLPSQNQRPELRALLKVMDKKYWSPLPKIVTQRLQSLTFTDVPDDDLNDLLKSLNKNYGTHITLTRVSAYLNQKLTHENIDPTIIALLTGTAAQTVPSTYYLGLYSHKLYETYRRYLTFLSRFHGDNALIIFASEPENIKLGSPLHVEFRLLQLLFKSLITKIKEQRKNLSTEQCHNDVTLYTQLVLALSSGYRPVTGWFGKLSHMHLATGDYWISDKESGIGDNSRVVTLSPAAIQVVRYYLEYCEQMIVEHGNSNVDLSRRYKQIVDGDEYLFFYQQEGELLPCTPSNYTTMIDDIWPLQPNWARHHIRSTLSQIGVDPTLINAWMGHATNGKRCYHSYSTLSRTQLEKVTGTIEEHLLQIGVETIQWTKLA